MSEEGGDGEVVHSETPSLLSYTLRYVSFVELGSACRVALREPMHLCTCVSEEGWRHVDLQPVSFFHFFFFGEKA